MLVGALTVGNSVRASLRSLAADRIGQTQYALAADGFFREQLAGECPLIALEAVVTHDGSGRRASRVALYGVDQRFFQFHGRAKEAPQGSDFLLSQALADELGSKPGDGVLVRVPRMSAIPAESLHGRKDDPGRTIRGSMREVIPRASMGEFSLRPQQGPVRAVFVSLERLQRDLDLDGRVNLGLSKNANIRDEVRKSFALEDVGLRLRRSEAGTIIEHESMILNDALVHAIRSTAADAQPVLTYLANSMRVGDRELPYSLVAGMERPGMNADDEIVLNDWAAKDLGAQPGSELEMAYYLWDPSGRLVTKTARFRVVAIEAVDPATRELAPSYPGISDAESVSDWDPPFPMELGKIRPLDEEYWDRYKATPKAFIRLSAAQQLWKSRYGQVTAMRVPGQVAESRLRGQIDPFAAGLTVQDVAQQSAQASAGTTDFAEYFLYFSFFLIVSALMLAGLFFRLGIEQRGGEIGTLRAVGYSVAQVRSLHLREGLLIAVIGSILGALGSLLYAGFIMWGLGTWWIDAVGTSELKLHMSPVLLASGIIAGLLMAPVAIYSSLRSLGRTPRERKGRRQWRRYLDIAFVLLALGLVAMGGPGGFFGAGALLLTAGLGFFSERLRRTTGRLGDLKSLGYRYASHRPGRSVLCAALIASATFMVVATDSFRRSGAEGEPGFRYFGESAIPIFYDPNSPEGRESLNIPGEVRANWLPFRLRPGDDASCLNLYQPLNPRVLGAPDAWIDPEWKLTGTAEGGAIPAAVDANSLQYVLHRKVGDVIEVGGAKLRVVTALHDSIFQSEIIVSEKNFLRVFPEEQGYRVFLVDASEGTEAAIEKTFADYGLDLTTTAARRAAFHRVENTYLSTFQMLGALGLMLGTVGLATVLLRNVLERRRELGLLRAVGYTKEHLGRMILAENLLLLFAGLGIGAVCAAVAVLPTAIQRGGTPPLVSIGLLLAAVLATGVIASWVALRAAIRAPFLNALRSE